MIERLVNWLDICGNPVKVGWRENLPLSIEDDLWSMKCEGA